MPATTVNHTPGLASFLKATKHNDIETSIELFISLLKRRQINNSRPCAIATAQLLLRVVASEKSRDPEQLIARIRHVGRRLVAAQPREMAVGNIVRRILGVVREVVEEDEDDEEHASGTPSGVATPSYNASSAARRPTLPHNISSFSPLHHGAAGPQDVPRTRSPSTERSPGRNAISDTAARRPALSQFASYASQSTAHLPSLLSFLEHPLGASTPTNGAQSPRSPPSKANKDLSEKLNVKAEVLDGIKELLDELDIVDSQIAESALDHVHNNEVILTTTSSQTVQKFLMTAARKRKFTVIHAESYPNDHRETHATIVNGPSSSDGTEQTDERWKPLTAMGITVILIPDTAVFALMSRINKVILAPHAVLANGSLVAAAGAATIAHAAKAHRVPVVVLSGVYKLSPVYPFDTHELIEHGDPSKVVPFEDGEFMDGVSVGNPVYDWVDAELVDLYITNLGGCAPSFLYRIVADHYRSEDVDLSAKQ